MFGKPTLHLLMGLPGSGKTTLAKTIEKLTGAVRLSSDEYRLMLFPKPTFSQAEHDQLYAILDANVDILLKAGRDVIYDANLNRYKHRQEKYLLGNKHGVDTKLWWLITPDDLAKQRRLRDQNHVFIPTGDTPEQLFERVSGVFEPPSKAEKPIAIDGSHLFDKGETAVLEALKT
jgi:predicted kinase